MSWLSAIRSIRTARAAMTAGALAAALGAGTAPASALPLFASRSSLGLPEMTSLHAGSAIPMPRARLMCLRQAG